MQQGAPSLTSSSPLFAFTNPPPPLQSETVLNITILVDRVATAVLRANYEKSAESSDVMSQWTTEERSKLYVWVRKSHSWPGEGFDGDIWGSDMLPLAKAEVPLSRKEEKAVFKFASR